MKLEPEDGWKKWDNIGGFLDGSTQAISASRRKQLTYCKCHLLAHLVSGSDYDAVIIPLMPTKEWTFLEIINFGSETSFPASFIV